MFVPGIGLFQTFGQFLETEYYFSKRVMSREHFPETMNVSNFITIA